MKSKPQAFEIRDLLQSFVHTGESVASQDPDLGFCNTDLHVDIFAILRHVVYQGLKVRGGLG